MVFAPFALRSAMTGVPEIEALWVRKTGSEP